MTFFNYTSETPVVPKSHNPLYVIQHPLASHFYWTGKTFEKGFERAKKYKTLRNAEKRLNQLIDTGYEIPGMKVIPYHPTTAPELCACGEPTADNDDLCAGCVTTETAAERVEVMAELELSATEPTAPKSRKKVQYGLAKKFDIDTGKENPFVAICTKHYSCIGVETIGHARYSAYNTTEFCDHCREEKEHSICCCEYCQSNRELEQKQATSYAFTNHLAYCDLKTHEVVFKDPICTHGCDKPGHDGFFNENCPYHNTVCDTLSHGGLKKFPHLISRQAYEIWEKTELELDTPEPNANNPLYNNDIPDLIAIHLNTPQERAEFEYTWKHSPLEDRAHLLEIHTPCENGMSIKKEILKNIRTWQKIVVNNYQGLENKTEKPP